MTRERCRELLPVMEAYARGEVVQLSTSNGKDWVDVTEGGEAMFGYSDTLYRIKPKPLEVWAVVESDGVWTYGGTREAVEAQLNYHIGRGGSARIVKLVEVVE